MDNLLELLEHPDFQEGDEWSRITLHAGQMLIEEGDNSTDVYVILSGEAQVNKEVDLDHNRNIQSGFYTLKTGDTLGELNLFDDAPRSASIIAKTELVVAKINNKTLIDFMNDNPAIGCHILAALFKDLAIRLRKSNERASSLFSWGLKQHAIDKDL